MLGVLLGVQEIYTPLHIGVPDCGPYSKGTLLFGGLFAGPLFS